MAISHSGYSAKDKHSSKIKGDGMEIFDDDFDGSDTLNDKISDNAQDDLEKKDDDLYGQDAGIFDGDDDSEIAPVKKYDKLRAKGTNYVFLFGSPASGKSYITTSLIYYLQTCALGRVRFPESNEKEAQILLEENYKRFHDGKLLDRTNTAAPPYEIDIVFTPNERRSPPMKITFLEMAGENLNKVKILKEDPGSGKLPDDINIYLQCPDINLIFFLVADHNNANNDSVLIDRFLNYVNNQNDRFGSTNNLLLITKWDTYPNKGQQSAGDFARIEMKQVMSYLKMHKIKNAVTSYSVGLIKREKKDGKEYEKIHTVETESASIVIQWLYETITGQTLKPKPTLWERFKLYMGI